ERGSESDAGHGRRRGAPGAGAAETRAGDSGPGAGSGRGVVAARGGGGFPGGGVRGGVVAPECGARVRGGAGGAVGAQDPGGGTPGAGADPAERRSWVRREGPALGPWRLAADPYPTGGHDGRAGEGGRRSRGACGAAAVPRARDRKSTRL